MDKNIIVQQKDHIILPNSTLKRFADDKFKKIYYLDLNDLDNISIGQITPKSHHVAPNYYNPQYDEQVKKLETEMGKLFSSISAAVANSTTNIGIDANTLKKQIIDFITIEYYRSVIADDKMLERYMIQQQRENDEINKILLKNGALYADRAGYSINFREKAKSIETFRVYAQNILGTNNNKIKDMYSRFTPHILHIPNNINNHFLLPPAHYTANDAFACFILSPDIALALYPSPMSNSLFLDADEERISTINIRSLEYVSLFYSDYRELIGEKKQLIELENRIKNIKSICILTENEIILDDKSIIIHNDYETLELVIILFTLLNAPKNIIKVRMIAQNFDEDFLLNHKKEIVETFHKYSFELVI